MNATVRIVFIYLLIITSCSAPSFEQSLEVPTDTDDLIGKIDSIAISTMNRYNVPGLALAVVLKDSVVHLQGYGQKNIDEPEQVSGTSIYHTASISKLFTALTIVHLVDDGRLQLDDRLVNLCPELNYGDQLATEITIASLLNHTSGLPDVDDYHWDRNHQSDDALELALKKVKIQPQNDPLTEYNYSNLGYDILGYVIQQLTGQSFEQFLKNSVLMPGGMSSSDFRYHLVPDSLKVTPHTKNWLTRSVEQRSVYPYTREHGPSSTLNASAADLSQWMIYFMENLKTGPLSGAYQQMIRPSHPDFPYIGLGFQLGTLDGFQKVGHYGGDQGFRSYLFMIPERDLGLVLLANCDYNEDFRQEILHPIGSLMLSQ